jgi:hypothetical protein
LLRRVHSQRGEQAIALLIMHPFIGDRAVALFSRS